MKEFKLKVTRKKIFIFVINLILIYVIGTPIGALRFAVARTGYPVKSITFELSEKTYKTDLDKNQTIYTLKNPPIEKATQGELSNWIVSRYGVFYWGSFYGW